MDTYRLLVPIKDILFGEEPYTVHQTHLTIALLSINIDTLTLACARTTTQYTQNTQSKAQTQERHQRACVTINEHRNQSVFQCCVQIIRRLPTITESVVSDCVCVCVLSNLGNRQREIPEGVKDSGAETTVAAGQRALQLTHKQVWKSKDYRK